MREQHFDTYRCVNGVTILGEQIPGVSSVAIAVLVPAGAAHDPAGLEGSSAILAELMNKGAGGYDTRALSVEFERCGILRSNTAGGEATVFSMSLLAEHVTRALELNAMMLLDPVLPEGELDSVRELALQDLEALEDEPGSKAMQELAARFYPHPFGRSHLGTIPGVRAVTIGSVKDHYRDVFCNQPLLVGVAGKYDWDEVVETCERVYGRWRGAAEPLVVPPPSTSASVHHIAKESHQVQIALAYPSVSLGHPSYYVARVAIGILSGGMAGRLFVEVREKRGLVYRVGASLSAARGRGAVFASAGTTPENAEQTLSVMVRELRGVGEGITAEELKRAVVELKSSLIMQSESSSVRAGALVSDWWNIRRLRPLREIQGAIEGVTADAIAQHQEAFPVSPLTLVTLGSKEVGGLT